MADDYESAKDSFGKALQKPGYDQSAWPKIKSLIFGEESGKASDDSFGDALRQKRQLEEKNKAQEP